MGEIGGAPQLGWLIGLVSQHEVSGGKYDWRDRSDLWLTTDGRLVLWSVGWYGDTGENLNYKRFASANELRAMDLAWTDTVGPFDGESGGTEHWVGARDLPYGEPPYARVAALLTERSA